MSLGNEFFRIRKRPEQWFDRSVVGNVITGIGHW